MPTKKPRVRVKEEYNTPLERFRKVFTDIAPPKGGLPTLHTTISEISSDELGNILARYSAWREFTEDRHIESIAVYAECKSVYDNACDKAMLKSNGATVTERKASAKVSSDVSLLASKVLEAETYMELLGGKLESFSNVLATLSRELTRRGVFNK